MDKPKWRTVNADKLNAEVAKLSSEIDAIMPTAQRTNDVGLAVKLHGLLATHNELVFVLNSLD